MAELMDSDCSCPVREELSNLSFQELQELQNKVGLKVYNQVVSGSGEKQHKESRQRPRKGRPQEMSSKKPVPFLRNTATVKKRVVRDPRFDDLSGDYNPEIFEKSYSFLTDIRSHEKTKVKQLLGTVSRPDRKQELEYVLQRMTEQDKARESKRQERERLKRFKQEQRQRVAEGSRPYFLKRSKLRELALADKFQALRRSSKVDVFLGKKRKRNAMKDRRKLPWPKAQ
ncbi:ribosomal RNA processing protein 36 homolog [Narcine bancroftii]|uniref:ribosomal RNA processing protein 36 homolog n=1 Tax=Narcine bancroftii TaxID=1343680 RepID=UPI003831244E